MARRTGVRADGDPNLGIGWISLPGSGAEWLNDDLDSIRLDIAGPWPREVRRRRMTPQRFEFRVNGPVSEDARYALCGLEVVDAPSETIIVGEVMDESHLHGVLALIRSLDLHLVSVHEVQD